jgi:hypothetical protein
MIARNSKGHEKVFHASHIEKVGMEVALVLIGREGYPPFAGALVGSLCALL